MRDCGPPVATATDPPPGYSWLTREQAENRRRFGCPICLPDDARIATPNGDAPISVLAPGTLVWSISPEGRRVARRVERVFSTPAPLRHRLRIIELDDGRRFRASPGHPDARGQPIGNLEVGDALDGARVRRVTAAGYTRRTYDLVLEDGATDYFVDGVRLRSSLSP